MKICLFNWNNILTDLGRELAKEHEVEFRNGLTGTKIKKYDLFILWNEVGQWGEFVDKVHKAGKKTILVQHGRRGTSRIHPPFNEKLNSDIVCVWGEADKERLISCGVDEKRIRIVGTSIFKHLKGRTKHEGKNVIFSPEHWDRDVEENSIVAGQLRRVKGAKIYSKLLDGEHFVDVYDNPILSQRNSPDHLEIVANTLAMADLVVAISESTFELLAESLDIPVVIADFWVPKACGNDERYKEYHREYSRACTRVKSPFDLPKIIEKELKNPSRLSKERKEVVLEDGGPDHFIENMKNVIKGLNI